MKAILFTNNPQVKEYYDDQMEVRFVDGGLLDVLLHVRDTIHQGHQLLSHPLTGSVKPNETPFKSVLVTASSSSVDMEGLNLIEQSIGTTKKLLNDAVPKNWVQSVLDDFMLIDFNLIKSGIESMTQF